MSYEIEYAPGILDRIEELADAEILDEFERAMKRLADNPVQHSRRSSVPFPPKGQQFDFHCAARGGLRVHFRVHFYYQSDEETLHVFHVKAVPYIAF